MIYFVGNWKMFGVPSSFKIINSVNRFISKDKNNKKYKILIAPPFTLLENFSKKFSNSNISICAQNCFHFDKFASVTGSISPYMISKTGVKNIIIGHSDNRIQGDNNEKLKLKVEYSLKNNLKIIFCIGENYKQKKSGKTFQTLKNQLIKVLNSKIDTRKTIVAYEPVWSIGTGKVPTNEELSNNVSFIKKTLKSVFKTKKTPAVLYGGSVDSESVKNLRLISEIDGFLIGGASKSSKKFIDIIKNYYK